MDKLELKDIADDLLIINKTTIDRLFQEDNKDALVLYMFYYKTAKWQNHNPIKASDEYSKKCLHWGINKVKAVKKLLKDMELIEVEKRINDKQQIDGWYIRINYYQASGTVSSGTVSPLVGKQCYKILNNNNKGEMNNNNKNTPPIIPQGNTDSFSKLKNKFLKIISESEFLQDKEQLKEKINEWLEYKHQRKDKPYVEIGFKKLLKQIENNTNTYGEQKIMDLIDECMSNNYQGIIFDKLKKLNEKKTRQQLLDEEIERWIKEEEEKNDKE